ncbi:type II toxin-antitoxin system RelE family toxin [Helicobacter sp. 23-1048]
MYKVDTSKELDKFFAKHRDLAPKIIAKLEIIAQNPYDNPCDIAKLQGQKNHYRLRVGKYRVLYEVRENQILVIYAYKADSRGDVYK